MPTITPQDVVTSFVRSYILLTTLEPEYLTTEELLDRLDVNKTLYTCLRCFHKAPDGSRQEYKHLMLDLSYYWDIEELNDTVKWHVLFQTSGLACEFVLEF
jgi:hypothetical protein